jgi:Mg/Co/Ni transporter MgtE
MSKKEVFDYLEKVQNEKDKLFWKIHKKVATDKEVIEHCNFEGQQKAIETILNGGK